MNFLKINLSEKRAEITAKGVELFDQIVNIPDEIRVDTTDKRTGIQIFMREVGTRNSVFISIYQPSENAQTFAVEKAVRSETLGHYSSQNSEDPYEMKFRGSVTVDFATDKYQASVSGLKGEEDVAVAVILLSLVVGLSVQYIIDKIVEKNGQLPNSFFDTRHYLNAILGL